MNYSKKIALFVAVITIFQAKGQNIPNTVSVSINPIVTDNFPSSYVSGNPINWMTTSVVKKPDTSMINVAAFSGADVLSITDYQDALGRPIQTVIKDGKISGYDQVVMSFYDEHGRNTIRPLPYVSSSNPGGFKKNAFSEYQLYYNSIIPTENIASGDSKNPYSKVQFDDNTLYRSITQMEPGAINVGNNNGVVTKFFLNDLSDDIKRWQYISVAALPTINGAWQDGTLFITEKTDKNGKRAREYKDKDGKIVLTKTEASDSPAGAGNADWLCTYFVYDVYNRLRQIITPKAVNKLQSNGWVMTQSIMDNLCYSYDYDSRDRKNYKKIPGKAAIKIVYDNNDRPVLMQDGNLTASNQWLFTKYDVFGRTIISGKYLNNFHYSASDLTNYFNGGTGSDPFLAFLIQPMVGNSYTTTSNLFSSAEIYELKYYDEYSNAPTGFSYNDAAVQALPGGTNSISSTKSYNATGMLTGGYVRVMDGNTATGQWESYALYYDNYGRVIQAQNINFKGGADTSCFRYDFSGNIISTTNSQKNPGAGANQISNVRTSKKYIRDNQGRLTQTFEQINDEPYWRQINALAYDYLGKRVATKTLGTNAETQKYIYRIWGDLESINKSFCIGGGLGNFFGEVISYDYGFSTTDKEMPSGMKWRLKGSNNTLRAYGYSYDAAGRLKNADYTQSVTGSPWANNQENYSALNMQYDPNGNIMHMEQWGTQQGYNAPFKMDDMTYSYNNGDVSNQLQAVTDAVTTNYNLGEFTEASQSATDYNYDANGNATTDNNKNITSILFNHNNKPYQINFTGNRIIKFSYDATGTLLSKQINDNGVVTNVDYLDGLEYNNNNLASIAQDEGRVRPVLLTNTSGNHSWSYEYDFFVKDHLGNVRSVITEEPDANWWDPSTNSPSSITYDPRTALNIASGYTVGIRNYRVTNELINGAQERALFSNVDSTRSDKPGSTSSTDLKATALSAEGNKMIGPSIVIKVSSGDKISIQTSAYYEPTNGDYTSNATPEQLASALVTALSGGGGYNTINEGGLAPDLTYNSVTQSRFVSAMQALKNQNTADGMKPQAFLNYLTLDDKLQVIDEQSGFVQTSVPGAWTELSVPQMDIKFSGYIIVFLSNESKLTVNFDNLNVAHYKGTLLEENHYYPYGLTLTTKALVSSPDNNKLLSGNLLNRHEFSDGTGLNWYDMDARQYDPQIGRWHSIDAKAEFSSNWSPYRYGFDNPILFSDPGGRDERDEDQDYNGPLLPGEQEMISGGRSNLFEEIGDWLRGAAQDVGNYLASGTSTDWEGEQQTEEMNIALEADIASDVNDGGRSNNEGIKERVFVFIWDRELPDKKDDLGHTAIRIGDESFGFYPTTSIWYGDGDMREHDIKKFQTDYNGDIITSFELNLTVHQKDELKKELLRVKSDPDSYSIVGWNCTSIAFRSLIRAGIEIHRNVENVYPYRGEPKETLGQGLKPEDFAGVLRDPTNEKIIKIISRFKVGYNYH